MTAQFTEMLSHAVKTHSRCTLPLKPHLDMSHKPALFAGLYGSAACTRRYVGVWEIAGGRLLLTRLHTLTEEDLPLDVLFPELQAPMFADWFTGTLRCPKGALLKYVHNDFQSIYEREWHIVVKNGLVQGERVEINPPPPRDPQEEWDIPECA